MSPPYSRSEFDTPLMFRSPASLQSVHHPQSSFSARRAVWRETRLGRQPGGGGETKGCQIGLLDKSPSDVTKQKMDATDRKESIRPDELKEVDQT